MISLLWYLVNSFGDSEFFVEILLFVALSLWFTVFEYQLRIIAWLFPVLCFLKIKIIILRKNQTSVSVRVEILLIVWLHFQREWADVKKDLQEERNNARTLTLDREQTIQNAMRQVEEMGKELSNALNAVASAESRAAVAEVLFPFLFLFWFGKIFDLFAF